MQIFVTGANGFVGRALCAHLLGAGLGVRALVRRAGTAPAGTTEVVGDITRPEELAGALAGAGAVIHCAARVPPEVTPEEAAQVNHGATVALARAAKTAGVPAFVFVSSVMAIGYREVGLVDEHTPAEPTEPYGQSKRAAEVDLATLADASFRVVTVRPPTVYGPTDTRGNFIAFARAVKKGFFPLPGGGANRMSFCHVTNLSEALRIAATHPDARGILHAADERPVTLRESAELVGEALGKRAVLLPIPLGPMHLAVGLAERVFGLVGREPPITRVRLNTVAADFAFDVRALERLGWRAAVSARDGMRDAVRAYQAAGLLG